MIIKRKHNVQIIILDQKEFYSVNYSIIYGHGYGRGNGFGYGNSDDDGCGIDEDED